MALQTLKEFWPAQLSLSIHSRSVLRSAVASSVSNLQPGGEPRDLDGSNFRHKVPPASKAMRATPSSGRWNYGREMADQILPESGDFHATFRVLLHAVKLRHGTDGFTSPPKEGVLRIFSPEKSDGLGRVRTREPKASTLPADHLSRFLH